MRRSILLAIVAALALAVGLSSVALAGQGSATTSAKKAGKKGKKRGCKAKGKGKAKGRNKGKARASAKKKGKGKSRGCKAKGGSLLAPGTYEGQDGIGLKVTAGGKQAALSYAPPFGSKVRVQTCIPIPLELPEEAATSTAMSFKAGGKTQSAFGGYGEIRWTIEVTSGLRYTLRLDSSHALPEQDPCNAPGAVFRGTLKKTG
ncbi:MAG TPA: hypothetical protein VFT19_10660 [Solirubrobacterales bacterium]|nr:hypothetical protein [Solirubrobacterales bacterium]